MGANQRTTSVPNTTYGGLFSGENLNICLIIHDYTCTIENSAVMDLISLLTKPVCVVLSGGKGISFIFSHTHTQSHIMGKSLMLMLRHWPWQRKRAHFSSFILLLSPSLSWSGAQLISTPLLSFSPSTSVCCSLHPPDAQAQKLCCIYSLHCILYRCMALDYIWNKVKNEKKKKNEKNEKWITFTVLFIISYSPWTYMLLFVLWNTKNNDWKTSALSAFFIHQAAKRTKKHKSSP